MSGSRSHAACGPLTALLMAVGLLAWALPAAAGEDLVAETYAQLDRLRDRKGDQLRQYLDRIHDLAGQAASDPVLTAFFAVKNRYYDLQQVTPPPPDAVAAIERAKLSVREHYLGEYLAFHDILFVDNGGDVFHTIRREADYHRNLFQPPLNDTALVARLRRDPDAGFVDYAYYPASGEPSAFFVEPVIDGGERAGWLILQCTIDKINRIFDRGEELGVTGEIFLVSHDRLMLTDSRFQPGSSVLRQHLSEANISAKFAERRGHKIVVDYRGERALTSFEVVPVMGAEWLLIAKIDEDEVITRAWRRQGMEQRLHDAVAAQAPPLCPSPPAADGALRVDMDEFRRAEAGGRLLTYGVSTCTAVVVGRPGRFAYLGHISPYDMVYGQGDMDLTGHILKRVRQFEVYPSEIRELEAVIVAPHGQAAGAIVARLLDAGLFLDQITVVQDPAARAANVVHDVTGGVTRVRWTAPDGSVRWVAASGVPSLGRLAGDLLRYPEAARRADTATHARLSR
jgi:hypothetical protein